MSAACRPSLRVRVSRWCRFLWDKAFIVVQHAVDEEHLLSRGPGGGTGCRVKKNAGGGCPFYEKAFPQKKEKRSFYPTLADQKAARFRAGLSVLIQSPAMLEAAQGLSPVLIPAHGDIHDKEGWSIAAGPHGIEKVRDAGRGNIMFSGQRHQQTRGKKSAAHGKAEIFFHTCSGDEHALSGWGADGDVSAVSGEG